MASQKSAHAYTKIKQLTSLGAKRIRVVAPKPFRSMSEAFDVVSHFARHGPLIDYRFLRCPNSRRYTNTLYISYAPQVHLDSLGLAPGDHATRMVIPHLGYDVRVHKIDSYVHEAPKNIPAPFGFRGFRTGLAPMAPDTSKATSGDAFPEESHEERDDVSQKK